MSKFFKLPHLHRRQQVVAEVVREAGGGVAVDRPVKGRGRDEALAPGESDQTG